MNNDFEIGEKLPDWDLEQIEQNQKIPTVDELYGKPTIILFFSLHCPGCLGRAIPFANRIVYENGENFNVVGIHTHIEGPETTRQTLLDAKEKYYIKFPYFADTGFAATYHKYRAGGTPHWIVLDKENKVVDSIFGSDPNRALLRLDYLIDELKNKK